MKVIRTQYIDGAFVESHGREVIDSINPNNGKVIARVTLGDEEDTRRAISAAKEGAEVLVGTCYKSISWTSAHYHDDE